MNNIGSSLLNAALIFLAGVITEIILGLFSAHVEEKSDHIAICYYFSLPAYLLLSIIVIVFSFITLFMDKIPYLSSNNFNILHAIRLVGIIICIFLIAVIEEAILISVPIFLERVVASHEISKYEKRGYVVRDARVENARARELAEQVAVQIKFTDE